MDVNRRFNCFPDGPGYGSTLNTGDRGTEDCLNLNLFIPKSVKTAQGSSEKLPVVMFLHGGDYVYGTANGGGTEPGLNRNWIRNTYFTQIKPIKSDLSSILLNLMDCNWAHMESLYSFRWITDCIHLASYQQRMKTRPVTTQWTMWSTLSIGLLIMHRILARIPGRF